MCPANASREGITLKFKDGQVTIWGHVTLSAKKVFAFLAALTLVILAIAKFGPQVWPYVAPLLRP